MLRHLEATQPIADYLGRLFKTPSVPFLPGYENENVDGWIEKFKLHLSKSRIGLSHEAAALELAVHLAGPGPSSCSTVYYNLGQRENALILKLYAQPLGNVTNQRTRHLLTENKESKSLWINI